MKKKIIYIVILFGMLSSCGKIPRVEENPQRCPNLGNYNYVDSVYECFEVDLEKVAESVEELSISASMPGYYQLDDGVYSIYSGYDREAKKFLNSDMSLLNLELYYKKMSENQDVLEIGDWLFFEGNSSDLKSYLFEKDGTYYQILYHLFDKRNYDEEYQTEHLGKDSETEYLIKFWMDYDELLEEDKQFIMDYIMREVNEREPKIKEYIADLQIEWEEDVHATEPFSHERTIKSKKSNVHYSVPIIIYYDGRMMLNVKKR